MVHWKNFPFWRIPLKRFWKSGIDPFLNWRKIKFSKIFEVHQVTNSHRLKQNKKRKKRKEEKECTGRESNPGLPRGRREFYHWTTSALHSQLLNKLNFNHVDISQTDKTNQDFDLRWQLIVRISTSINKIQVSLHNDNLYNQPWLFAF